MQRPDPPKRKGKSVLRPKPVQKVALMTDILATDGMATS